MLDLMATIVTGFALIASLHSAAPSMPVNGAGDGRYFHKTTDRVLNELPRLSVIDGDALKAVKTSA